MVSPDLRQTALDIDRYEKFNASLAASFDLKYHGLKSDSFIQVVIIVASQIDAYLRLTLLLKYQIDNHSNNMPMELLYQGESDNPITERKIYKRTRTEKILDQIEFDELERLYRIRNKMVHRYIISEFRTRQILELAYDYELICETVRLKLKKYEDMSHEKKVGIYSHRDPTTEHPPEDINFLYSQVNDKHLTSELKRKIKASNSR